MNTMIVEAAGQISMCWEPIPAGVFDSSAARKICDELEHKLPKYIELRDNMTFVPVLATPVLYNAMTRKAGYGPDNNNIILLHLQTSQVEVESYKWKSDWMSAAHEYIQENWFQIQSQSVIDFRVIRGEPVVQPEVIWP